MNNRHSILVFAFLPLAVVFQIVGCAAIDVNAKRKAFAESGELGGTLSKNIAVSVYEGSGQGYSGRIHIRVHVKEGNIAEIIIVDSCEDPFIGGAAIEELLELALIYNTANLDAISGATESSEGFLAALASALEQAAKTE